ncbi:MAG: SCP2 sterol-binding domain-containing protein [Deltaproteobacteria bacterium]|nr:SCP2 sterol-binding domain-containing protein [Deltaproteobacteria bacterium]
MRILLVRVAGAPKYLEAMNRVVRMEPLSLEYLGAAVKGDHDVKLLDMRLEGGWEGLRRTIESFQPEAAAGMSSVIQFDITGEGGGTWRVVIENDARSVVEGAVANPDLVITASAKDYVDISTGALNEQLAFMTGRIRAKGNLGLAMKLPRIFKR